MEKNQDEKIMEYLGVCFPVQKKGIHIPPWILENLIF